MNWKKLGKALLFPHLAIMIALVPIASAFLVLSMVFLGTESLIAIVSYVVAAYTLTVWCAKIPELIQLFKAFKNKNKYMIRWRSDARLRITVSLYASLALNVIYALFQLWLGFYHRTFWFYSLGAYYVCLSVMRFFLLDYAKRYNPGEKMESEIYKYRACGWVLLVMNMALTVIVFFMLYWNRSFEHNMITAIAMAAYTFTAFTVAIVNIVKYKKYNSPVFSASKAISLIAAGVSMLTLTSTLLTTFNDGKLEPFEQKLMLGGVGFTVAGAVLALAIYMIVEGNKRLKQFKAEVQNGEQ